MDKNSFEVYAFKDIIICILSYIFSTNKNWPPRYNWNIVESGVKHYKPNQTIYRQNLVQMEMSYTTIFTMYNVAIPI